VTASQPDSTEHFGCECDDPACGEMVTVTQREYESVRASPTRFLIVADHEDPQVEYLITENARFAIVENGIGHPTRTPSPNAGSARSAATASIGC
jgi:hypothetical protein